MNQKHEVEDQPSIEHQLSFCGQADGTKFLLTAKLLFFHKRPHWLNYFLRPQQKMGEGNEKESVTSS